jgi:predicted permease
VKFVLLPAILYGLTTLFVTDPAMMTCVVLSAGAPTAIFAVAAAQLYGLNVDLAESSFVTTTLAFLFVLYPLVYWWVEFGVM